MLFAQANENPIFFPVVLRDLVPAIGAPWILPLGGGEILPLPFPTIHKAEGGAMDVLYASIIQGSYFCTQTAAS